MRIALISDIHGNFQALEAVIKDIAQSNVQSMICLGDIISLGIQPREVIDLLMNLDCHFVIGNHDEPFIDYAKLAMLSLVSVETFISNKWTLSRITDEQRDFIATFKQTLKIEHNGWMVLCFHGSPRCTYEGIFPDTKDEIIDTYLSGYTETIFAGGHTHIQMMRESTGRVLVNPGSVGSVFDDLFVKGEEPVLRPWAEYGILDLSGEKASFERKNVSFDIEKLRQVITETDYPYKEWWSKQYSGQW